MNPTHAAWADETNYNKGRYRGIALISMPWKHVSEHRMAIHELLVDSDVTEFKWTKLSNAKYKFAAMKMLQYSIERAVAKSLRIDVLVWDIEDSRHKLKGRDDIANLQRMYYHILHNVMRNRWPNDSSWHLYPDEQTALDWETITDVLQRVGSRLYPQHDFLAEKLQQEFSILQIAQCQSLHEPLVQLTDLFAGLTVYSRESYDKYMAWKTIKSGQSRLFQDENAPSISNADEVRCDVLLEMMSLLAKYDLTVSLEGQKGLQTKYPQNPVNFWLYIPQHSHDKAPQRR